MSAQTDIAADLTRILGAKSDLKTSIEGKGVTVPSATKIDGYAALVDQIQQGGGGHTGTVDTAGLQALGWDSYDIQWLQDHVWWDAEDDAEWAVTEANKAFGPNGATPLTWNTRSSIQYNPDCRYLPKLTIPSNATNLQYAFNNFVYLVAIPTHGWDMTGKTSFRSMFTECVRLRSLGDISRWNTSSVTDMVSMFMRCASLESLDLSHWNTASVTGLNAFVQFCTELKSLDVSGFSFASVTSLQTFIADCPNLEAVKLPATITASALTNMSQFASNSYSLKSLSLILTAPLLTNAASAFSNCILLKSLVFAISGTALTTLTNLVSYCERLDTIDYTGIDTTSVTQSGAGAGDYNGLLSYVRSATTIKLGANFFKGSFTTLYAQSANSWSRDSIYESLYTNQTTRDSNSNAVTVKLATQAYDRLSAQDISDIATKNITLTRG